MRPALEKKYTAPPPDFTRYKLLEIERITLETIVRRKFIGLSQGRPWAFPVHIRIWSKGSCSRSIFSTSAPGVALAKMICRVAHARRARRTRRKLRGASGRDTRVEVTWSQPAVRCSTRARRHRQKARQA